MRLAPEQDDAPAFISIIEQLLVGLVRDYKPAALVLIKIDNWFGSKWLGFSGKVLGAVGSWHIPRRQPADHIRIPPFVPNRILSQRRFAGPAYDEIGRGRPIHTRIPSDLAVVRKAAIHVPDTALVWFSGNSKATGRGSLMAYVPANSSYWPWYAAWKSGQPWYLTETREIRREQISRLTCG